MNELQIFEHQDFGQIRVLEQDGEPWFVAADVCRALEHTNVTMALDRLDEDEKSKFGLGLPGGDTWCVNEPGLYSLVLGSRKPEAKTFKRWITHEVLPSIRQTGTYSLVAVPPIVDQRRLTTDDYLKAAAIVANCRNERLPYVLGFLEQGGFSVPRLQDQVEELPEQTVTAAINAAIKEHGFTVAQLCNLTGIDKVQMGRYRRGISRPKKERALFLVKVITDAISKTETP